MLTFRAGTDLPAGSLRWFQDALGKRSMGSKLSAAETRPSSSSADPRTLPGQLQNLVLLWLEQPRAAGRGKLAGNSLRDPSHETTATGTTPLHAGAAPCT